MSTELELRWLKPDKLHGATKRFAEFCKEDILAQSTLDGFDSGVYQDSIKLVLEKLDDSVSIKEMFDAD